LHCIVMQRLAIVQLNFADRHADRTPNPRMCWREQIRSSDDIFDCRLSIREPIK
jgi:hypothetical protein